MFRLYTWIEEAKAWNNNNTNGKNFVSISFDSDCNWTCCRFRFLSFTLSFALVYFRYFYYLNGQFILFLLYMYRLRFFSSRISFVYHMQLNVIPYLNNPFFQRDFQRLRLDCGLWIVAAYFCFIRLQILHIFLGFKIALQYFSIYALPVVKYPSTSTHTYTHSIHPQTARPWIS